MLSTVKSVSGGIDRHRENISSYKVFHLGRFYCIENRSAGSLTVRRISDLIRIRLRYLVYYIKKSRDPIPICL